MSENYTSESHQSIDVLNSIKALRWQCRRGMLELDIVLARFLNNRYEKLAASEQQQFAELLTATDPELYSWLVTATETPPTHLEAIVNAIRTPIIATD